MESIFNTLNNSLGGPDIVAPDLQPKLLDLIDPMAEYNQAQQAENLSITSSSEADPTASFLTGALKNGPSLSTQAQPTFFNPQATQLDRYTNSSYYAELGFDPRRNNEELYASNQSWGDVMGQAFSGAGRLASNTFIEGWKGWGRLADAITSFDASKLQPDETELYQMAKTQEDIMNKYAIFRNKESEQSVFNKQFFGDLVQNSGFAVGTIAQALSEELLTFGAASVFSATKLGMKVMRGVDALQDVEEFARLNKSLGDIYKNEGLMKTLWKGFQKYNPIGSTTQALEKAYVAGKAGAGAAQIAALSFNGFRRTLSEANMARTEAVFEAAGTYKELKDNLVNEHLNKTGEMPVGADLERINKVAKEASSDNFDVNFGMLLATNRIQFDNMFGHFNAERRLFKSVGQYADDVLKVTGKIGEKEATKVYTTGSLGALGAVKEIAKDFGNKEAAWQVAKSFGKNTLKWETSEGLQELFQEGSNKGLQNYYYDLYHGRKAQGNSKVDSVFSAIDNPLTNMQGAKTFLMGAVTGRLLSPINFAVGQAQERVMTSEKDRAERKKDIDTSVSALNEFYKNPYAVLKDEIANFKVQNVTAATMQEAVANKDKYTYYNARDTAFAKAVAAAKKTGMTASLVDTIRGYGDTFSAEDAKEAYGLDPTADSQKSVKDYFNKIADDVESYSKNWELLNEKYGDLIKPDLYAEGSQGKKDAQLLKGVLDDYIEMLSTNSFKAKSSAERANKLYQEAAANPVLGAAASSAYKILGSQSKMLSEMDLLTKEIANLKGIPKRTKEEARLLAIKTRQLDAIAKWYDSWENLVNREESNMSKREQRYAKDAYKRFINYKNEESGIAEVKLANTDIDETYEGLLEYIQLNQDSEAYLDAYNFLADPVSIVKYANRMKAARGKVQEQLATEAKEEVKGNVDPLSKAVIPGDNETNDTSDLTEDVVEDTPLDTADIPAASSVDIEAFLQELKDVYITLIKDKLQLLNGDQSAYVRPSQFIKLAPKAAEVLASYGIDKKDVSVVDDNVGLEGYEDVEFVYNGSLSSNSIPSEVDTTSDVDTTPTPTEDGVTPVDVTEVPEGADVEDVPTTTNQDEPDPDQTTFEEDPKNYLEVNGVKFVLGHYVVASDDPDNTIKITGVSPNDIWVDYNGVNLTFTKEDLADRLAKGEISVVSNPKGKEVATPVKNPTQVQKDKADKQKTDPVDDVDYDDLEYTTDNEEEEYIDSASEGNLDTNERIPINSGSKVNNRSDNVVVDYDKNGDKKVKRGNANQDYPLIMGTSRIKIGTPISFEIDVNIENFDDYDYVQGNSITKRSKTDFFNEDGTIKPEVLDDFPVAIYTEHNGKKIKLGYLPTVKFVTARFNDSGKLAHTKEFVTNSAGETIDNLKVQTDAIKDHRQRLFNAYNKNQTTVFTSAVVDKSVGVLRTDGVKKTLKQAMGKGTKVAIAKKGAIHTGEKTTVDDIYVPKVLKDAKANGWPVAIIPTPTGKPLASLVVVPVLKQEQLDFILASWRAFHSYNNDLNNGANADSKDLAIIKAVYDTYGIEFIDGEKAAFEQLSKYINDYVTHTSSKKYNPMSQGKAHFNITPAGLLSVWKVNSGDQKKDSVIIGKLSEISQEKMDRFYEIAGALRHSIKFGTPAQAGIGSEKKFQTLSIDANGNLKKSSAMTYNDYMMETLETQLEAGRPYEGSQEELVHFSNPVVVFGPIDGSTPASKGKAPVAPTPVAPTEAPTTDARADIERRRQEELNEHYEGLTAIMAREDAYAGDDRISKEINAKYDAELEALGSQEEGKVDNSAYISMKDSSKKDKLDALKNMDFGDELSSSQDINSTPDVDDLKDIDDKLKSAATTTKKLEEDNKLNKKCN